MPMALAALSSDADSPSGNSTPKSYGSFNDPSPIICLAPTSGAGEVAEVLRGGVSMSAERSGNGKKAPTEEEAQVEGGGGDLPPPGTASLARRRTPSQERLLFHSTWHSSPYSSAANGQGPSFPRRRHSASAFRPRTSLLSSLNDAVGGATSPPHLEADLPPPLDSNEEAALLSDGGEGDDGLSDGYSRLSVDGGPGEEERGLLGRARSRSRSNAAETGGRGEDKDKEEQEKQYGVLKAEIVSRRLRAKNTGWGLWGVYIGIYVLSISTSIETNALPVVEPYFLSLFEAHGLLGSVGIVQNIAYAVGKPPTAKIMDVFGRPEGVLVSAALYFLGAILTSSAHSVVQYSFARIAAALGSQGLQLAQQIIVADTSPLSTRALLTSTVSSPWIVTTWIGPWIGEWFKEKGETGYRAVYAGFAVVVPVCAVGLAGLLWWEWKLVAKGIESRRSVFRGSPPLHSPVASVAPISPMTVSQRRHSRGARDSSSTSPQDPQLKLSDKGSESYFFLGPGGSPWRHRSAWSLVKEAWTQLDMVGIGLLTVGCSMVLLPLTLESRKQQSWADPKLYVLLLAGAAVLAVFGLYETRFATAPILPARLMKERTILMGSAVCFWHFVCQFIYESYFTSFLQVARYTSARDAQYISESYIFTACVSAILCGFLVKWSRRYKIWVLLGILLHGVGAILMVRFRRLENPMWELVLSQVIAGAGGGFTTLGAQLGVQSVVSHQDVGIATAVFLTITQVGGAVGASIAGAVWTTLLPKRLAQHLPASEHDKITNIVNDLNVALSYSRGTSEREAVDAAYVDVQRLLNWLSLFALGPTMAAACHMKNVDLTSHDPASGEGDVILGMAERIDEEAEGESENSSLLGRSGGI